MECVHWRSSLRFPNTGASGFRAPLRYDSYRWANYSRDVAELQVPFSTVIQRGNSAAEDICWRRVTSFPHKKIRFFRRFDSARGCRHGSFWSDWLRFRPCGTPCCCHNPSVSMPWPPIVVLRTGVLGYTDTKEQSSQALIIIVVVLERQDRRESITIWQTILNRTLRQTTATFHLLHWKEMPRAMYVRRNM